MRAKVQYGLDNPSLQKVSFKMQDCKPVSTPVDTSSKRVVAEDDDECFNQLLYQSAIGSLLYLSVSTIPDITYAVGNLARFSSKPTKTHWTVLKRVLRYLKGTMTHGIIYTQKVSNECVGFADVDWAGDVNDRKSTSGYLWISVPNEWRPCHLEEQETRVCCTLDS